MNILSIVYGVGCHDTAAALVCDGSLVAAVEEERFTRQKHDSALPFNAIEFCLAQGRLDFSDIDQLVFCEKIYLRGTHSYTADVSFRELIRMRRHGLATYRTMANKLLLNTGLGTFLPRRLDPLIFLAINAIEKRYSCLPRIRSFDHHLCHAAAAYYTSGLTRSAVVTADYNGGPYATVTWNALGKRITRLRAELLTNSLGRFYWECTRYLGLGDFADGKTMGLAAWGDPGILSDRVGELLSTESSTWYQYRHAPSHELLRFPPRSSEHPILEPPYPHFAASVQEALERAMQRVVRSSVRDAGTRHLCLGGGVALNCSSNGALLQEKLVNSLWVFPASHDAGLCVGGALLSAVEAGEWSPCRIDHAYWGPEYSSAECSSAILCKPELEISCPANLVQYVARKLADGCTVGWFQGRMEFGPRALGNRSILADPRRIEMRDKVNRLKNRELWRPLAPVVPRESARHFFDIGDSPFMLVAATVHAPQQESIPAVVHVDGTARPQTVTRDQNFRFYELLTSFGEQTGVPVLLNTSFNQAGEPIVCTPKDAVRTFLNTGLDVLVLGNYIATRKTR